ncbi:hypothetical protein [Nonomuraea sp. B5E05]|uniref:hypothetical protein n=1 Tax=Nonomuraea sp. B5E05 TaxID=3153569 RepID=UPI00325FF147
MDTLGGGIGGAVDDQPPAGGRLTAPLIALRIEDSPVEGTVERDLIPMAREMGLGVVPWPPPASGVLTGGAVTCRAVLGVLTHLLPLSTEISLLRCIAG